MNYHPDDFLRIEEAIEDTGGARVAGTCEPKRLKYTQRDSDGKKRFKEANTHGCHNESRFFVPYRKPNAANSDTLEDNQGLATVCVVADDVGRWPKFAHLIQEDSN